MIHTPPPPTSRQYTDVWVLGALLFLCVSISSGRLMNGDTPGLIDAAVRFYDTGSFGAPAPIGVASFAWLQAPNGQYYESHDIGGPVAFLPAVWMAHRVDPSAATFDAYNPAIRWGASLTTNLMNAFTLWFIYLACRRLTTLPKAVGWILAMLFGSFFVAYCRMVFDMSGAAMGFAFAVYYSIKVLDSAKPKAGDLIGVAIGLSVGVFFRFSLFPTAGLTLGILCLMVYRQLNARFLVLAMAVLLIGMSPSLAYNKIRSGKPFDPPNHTDQFGPNKLRKEPVNIAKGLFGLTFGPNSGFFTYTPWLIPVLFVPLRWKQLPMLARRFALTWGPGMLGYVGLLSMVSSWGGPGGWGPRYLLPAIGVAVVLMIASYAQTLGRLPRGSAIFAVLLVIGLLANAPTAFVNIRAAGRDAPYNLAQGVVWPSSVASVWRAMALEWSGSQVSNRMRERSLTADSYEMIEMAGKPVVFDLPLYRDGLSGGGFVQLVVLMFLTIGMVCCGMSARSISHSLKVVKVSE